MAIPTLIDVSPDGTPAQQVALFRGTYAVVAAPIKAWPLTDGWTFVTVTPALATDSRTINAAKAASSDRPTFCAALAADLNTTGGGTTAFVWTVNGAGDGLIGTAKAIGMAYNSVPTGTCLTPNSAKITTLGQPGNADMINTLVSLGLIPVRLVDFTAAGTETSSTWDIVGSQYEEIEITYLGAGGSAQDIYMTGSGGGGRSRNIRTQATDTVVTAFEASRMTVIKSGTARFVRIRMIRTGDVYEPWFVEAIGHNIWTSGDGHIQQCIGYLPQFATLSLYCVTAPYAAGTRIIVTGRKLSSGVVLP
jgi:hypothetical protein